ncbi:hypothetical protein GGR51DRAFT_574945 [Nemania sp. FL0031]|nr:hypothetical protein GGR51DRAFT_574945 [Nemania sp. FL0031]
MVSAQDIASQLAYMNGKLTEGGTNTQMREWWTEYKRLREELKEAKAAGGSTPNSTTDTTVEETAQTAASDTVETKTSQKKNRKVTIREPTDDEEGSIGPSIKLEGNEADEQLWDITTPGGMLSSY